MLKIEEILKIVADQKNMIDTTEDRLDQVVADVLSKTNELTWDELEDVQAAVLPFGEWKKGKLGKE